MFKKGLVGFGVLLMFMSPVFGLDKPAAPAAKAPAVTAPAAAVPAKVSVKKAAPVPGDEAGVKDAFERFSKAWAAGDAKARAEVFTTDGSVINPFGQEAWGRAELEKLFEQESATVGKGTQHTFDHFRITFLMPTVALVDCDGTISGIKNPAGQAMPDQKLHIFVVAVKKMGSKVWQCRFARPTIFAPLPGTEASAAAPAADPAMPEVKTDKK